MKSSHWSLRTCWVVVVLTAVSLVNGCDTVPSAGPSRGIGAPQVTSVLPASVPLTDTAQLVKITGNNFREGLVVEMTDPDGVRSELRGTAIENRHDTSFDLRVVFTVVGAHRLVVRNPDNRTSSPVTLDVREDSTPPAPIVTAIVPASVPRSMALQTITLQGLNFDPGVQIEVTDPSGLRRTLPAVDVTRVNDTTISLTLFLDQQGQYTFVVTNPSGRSSGPVTLPVT